MVYNNLLNKNISLRILHTFSETIVDGPGLRYSIYFSGCSHQCDGCHNMKSWNPLTGDLVNDEVLLSIVNEINSNDLLDGITISGGDPLYNPEDLYFILKYLKEHTNKNIWLYTGYILEEIKECTSRSKCLEYIDTLVEGKFIKELYDPNLTFIGSGNQRIIPKSNFISH